MIEPMYRQLFFLLLLSSTAAAQCDAHRSFAAEADPCLDKAPPAPAGVIQAILKTEAAATTKQDMEPSELAELPHLFHGQIIHLHSASQKDMIVRGQPPMSGADNVWFWIVTSIDHNPKAYWIHGLAVKIIKHKTNGYADISTSGTAGSSTVCTQELRHNGTVYVEQHPKCEEIK